MRRSLSLLVVCGAVSLASASAFAAPEALPKPANKAAANKRYDEAKEAYKAGDYVVAALKFDAAFAYFGDIILLWNGGRAWERALELEVAKARFQSYLDTGKLDAKTQAETEEALVRVDAAIAARDLVNNPPEVVPEPIRIPLETPPAPARSRVLPIALIASGGALVAGGVVMGLVGQGDLDEITAAQEGADNGTVTRLSRLQAVDLESRGTTLRTLGFVTSGLGLAAATTGVLLWVLNPDPTTQASTQITLAPTKSGLKLCWISSF